jgi:hypothetical protein
MVLSLWRSSVIVACSISLALSSYIPGAHATPWIFNPAITAVGTYTDNSTLAPSGKEKEQYIIQLNPALTITRETGRFRTEFDYLMQNLFYPKQHLGFPKSRNANNTHHQIFGDATYELLRETLLIDASTTFSQQIIDPQGKVSNSNINRTGNTTDTFTARIGPNWRYTVGPNAVADFTYTFGVVRFLDQDNPNNTNDSLQDSLEHNVKLDISSQVQQRTSWSLLFNWDRIEFEDDRVNVFRKAGVELGYPLTGVIDFIALGGYEDNEFDNTSSTTRPDGPWWEVGLGWQPTTRDHLEARYGERFFGDTKNFLWNHEGNKISTRLEFIETLGTGNQQLVDVDFVPGGGLNPDVPRFRDEVFLERRLDANITAELAKTTIEVDGFWVEREYQIDTDRNYGGSVIWGWQFRPRTHFELEFNYLRSKFGGSENTDFDNSWTSLTIDYLLGPRTTGYIQATHRRRDSDDALNNYTENTISLGITRAFGSGQQDISRRSGRRARSDLQDTSRRSTGGA